MTDEAINDLLDWAIKHDFEVVIDSDTDGEELDYIEICVSVKQVIFQPFKDPINEINPN